MSFLIVFLLYATYQPLRFAIEDPERQSRYASVFAITAGRVRADELHRRAPLHRLPAPARARQHLQPARARWRSRSWSPWPAIALLFATLCKYELTAKHTRAQVRALRRRLLGERAAAAQRGRSAAPALHASTTMARAPREGRARRWPRCCSPNCPPCRCTRAGKYVAGAYVVLFALVLDLRGDHGDPPEPHRARARRAAGDLRERERPAQAAPAQPAPAQEIHDRSPSPA